MYKLEDKPYLKYLWEDQSAQLTESLVQKWLTKIETNELNPYFKSQDRHEYDPSVDPVRVIVGKDFMETVKKGTTFLMIYSQDCGYCN